MDKYKLLERIKNNPHSTNFNDFVKCIEKFGFVFVSQVGSHKKYIREGIPEFVDIQNKKGKAKHYQIKQFVKLVNKYNL
jgi:hypothetical protein